MIIKLIFSFLIIGTFVGIAYISHSQSIIRKQYTWLESFDNEEHFYDVMNFSDYNASLYTNAVFLGIREDGRYLVRVSKIYRKDEKVPLDISDIADVSIIQ